MPTSSQAQFLLKRSDQQQRMLLTLPPPQAPAQHESWAFPPDQDPVTVDYSRQPRRTRVHWDPHHECLQDVADEDLRNSSGCSLPPLSSARPSLAGAAPSPASTRYDDHGDSLDRKTQVQEDDKHNEEICRIPDIVVEDTDKLEKEKQSLTNPSLPQPQSHIVTWQKLPCASVKWFESNFDFKEPRRQKRSLQLQENDVKCGDDVKGMLIRYTGNTSQDPDSRNDKNTSTNKAADETCRYDDDQVPYPPEFPGNEQAAAKHQGEKRSVRGGSPKRVPLITRTLQIDLKTAGGDEAKEYADSDASCRCAQAYDHKSGRYTWVLFPKNSCTNDPTDQTPDNDQESIDDPDKQDDLDYCEGQELRPTGYSQAYGDRADDKEKKINKERRDWNASHRTYRNVDKLPSLTTPSGRRSSLELDKAIDSTYDANVASAKTKRRLAQLSSTGVIHMENLNLPELEADKDEPERSRREYSGNDEEDEEKGREEDETEEYEGREERDDDDRFSFSLLPPDPVPPFTCHKTSARTPPLSGFAIRPSRGGKPRKRKSDRAANLRKTSAKSRDSEVTTPRDTPTSEMSASEVAIKDESELADDITTSHETSHKFTSADLRVMRRRVELPPPNPNRLCFRTSLSGSTHGEVKQEIEVQRNVKVTWLQYDPIYLQGYEDVQEAHLRHRCMWIFELSTVADMNKLLLEGFRLRGVKMNIRPVDDVYEEEYRAFALCSNIFLEQHSKSLGKGPPQKKVYENG